MDHVVQQMAEVRLVDPEEPLHRGRGEADLVADDGGPVGQSPVDVVPLHGMGVGRLEARQQGRQRLDRIRSALALAQQPCGLRALSVGQGHHPSLLGVRG
ncbi:hypothetical protein [Streptomyces sp. P17]|uniref:hypothetical protein n=1 Tax=Streptomyces sp. P17 TaxID=3074716 RepID=UPI0028F420AC|nr:hypothetical protein [Streptomyces sp. P17]MDT9699205.1 hypothetical protein [Streptomyces sp. P17]